MAIKKTIKKAISSTTVKNKGIPDLVTVVRGTTTVRVFTKDKNGKDFVKLAESFATKHGYEIKAG